MCYDTITGANAEIILEIPWWKGFERRAGQSAPILFKCNQLRDGNYSALPHPISSVTFCFFNDTPGRQCRRGVPVVAGDELSPYWPPAPEAAVLTNYTLGIERRSEIIQVTSERRSHPHPRWAPSPWRGEEWAPTHFRVA